MSNDENHNEERKSLKPTSLQMNVESVKTLAQPVPIMAELALMRCLAMLQQFDFADPEVCTKITEQLREKWDLGEGADPIDILTRMRAAEGSMLDSMVEMASMKMARSLSVIPPRIPFASQLIPPTGFYDKWPEIAYLCEIMQVPVAYAEDLDVIGLASINPYFSEALAIHMQEEFKKEGGLEPIVTTVRLDRISWMKMCEKHFSRG